MSLFVVSLIILGLILFAIAMLLQSSLVNADSGIRKQNMEVNGHPLKCAHCGSTKFTQGSAQLHTTVLTFFKLEWLNKSADTFICSDCGRIEWFMDAKVKAEGADKEGNPE